MVFIANSLLVSQGGGGRARRPRDLVEFLRKGEEEKKPKGCEGIA